MFLCRPGLSISALVLLITLLAPISLSDSAVAQTDDATKSEQNTTTPPVDQETPALVERQAAAQQELADIDNRLGDLTEDAPATLRTNLQETQAILQRVTRLIAQSIAADVRIQELQDQHDELVAALDQIRIGGLEDAAPYSILKLDQYRDDLQVKSRRTKVLESAVAAAQTALTDAQQEEIKRQRELRLAKDRESSNSDASLASELAAERDRARLNNMLATERRALNQRDLKRERLARDTHGIEITLLEIRIDLMEDATSFPKTDLDAKLLEIATAQTRATRTLQAAQDSLDYLEREWLAAKNRESSSLTDSELLRAEVAARKGALESSRERVDALNKKLEHLADAELIWNRRFELIWSQSAVPLKTWEDEATDQINTLDIDKQILQVRADEVRDELGAVAERIDGLSDSESGMLRWLTAQREHLQAIDATLDERRQSNESTRRLHAHLLASITTEQSEVSFGERMKELWASTTSIWNFEVWAVEDHPITVGKIVIGLLVLCFGMFAARLLSSFIGKRILPRLKLNEGAAAAIQSLLFYILVVTFVLIAFRAVSIPLTAFTVVGGALAIGIGFGSQNILANFISGLILIAERPISVGDLIEVGTLFGTVDHIGARSTRVRTADNVEIVVPNSTLLEQNVINWTLSERKVRTRVAVGVAYGSPTRDVAKLLMRAIEDHGRVLKKPAPTVLFTQFGDNALQFEVRFWITMNTPSDRDHTASDVRHRIASLFNDAGIAIAFPQRDVHLDVTTPIEVRMLDESDGNVT